jgi:hypothetical protein
VVSPLVQTASSSRPTLSDQSHHTAYERVLAAGLGAALAAVAAVALLVPTVTTSPTADAVAGTTVAQGKATPLSGAASSTTGDAASAQ